MSLIHDLAKVREMQGKEPLPDPGVIQGFGPGNPPSPDAPYLPPAHDPDTPPDWLDPELDAPPVSEVVPPSPLIPRQSPAPRNRPNPQPAPPLPMPDLVVLDRVASFKGRDVALSEEDEREVRGVVLRALRREVDAALRAVEPPRKARTPRTAPAPAPAPEGQAEPPKRRRGRPRGSLLVPRT